MRLLIFLGVAIVIASPVKAQVIEIESDGEAHTYDGPTVFTDEGATRIIPTKLAETSSNSATLLAEAAQRHNVDQALLNAVAWQESNGRMSAVSGKGALGVMQLMPTTAAELGVNPKDLADNIRGGAMYLRRQLDRFGSVPLALAAYNAGPGAVLRYRGVPPFRETQDYVSRIMQRWHAQVPQVRINPENIEVPHL